MSRQELVGHLQQQIAEQKRIDLSTSGTAIHSEVYNSQSAAPVKEAAGNSSVQLLLPGDTKKQRKQVKQIFLDRGKLAFPSTQLLLNHVFHVLAYDKGLQIKSAIQGGMPILAVDVPTSLFNAMTKSVSWITDDDAWRAIISSFAPAHSTYAWQVREAVEKRKAEGHGFIMLFAVREERIHLLALA